MNIIVSQEIEQACPSFVGACVEAYAENSAHNEALWDEINSLGNHYRTFLTTDTVKELPGIAATLIRRQLQGKSLYQINTLVDLVNLASIAYGYSIGGFDADKFVGDTLTLGIGREGEPYEGIGRGMINIAGLPVYRDAKGGVGTPTSDNERTKIAIETTHLMVLINGYDGDEDHVRKNAEYLQQLLRKYAKSDGGTYQLYR